MNMKDYWRKTKADAFDKTVPYAWLNSENFIVEKIYCKNVEQASYIKKIFTKFKTKMLVIKSVLLI